MPTDPDRVYAKKHKINDLLNELYLQLTKNKPENPIEFAIKHLEDKLPPKEKVEPVQRSEPGKDLLKSLMIQKFSSPMSTFNIMNRISQSIVKANKQLTDEEILEKEIISYHPKYDEEPEKHETNNVAGYRYKNEIKNRKLIEDHKNEIKKLVESQLAENNNLDQDQPNDQISENYNEELMCEMINSGNVHQIIEKEPNKKEKKLQHENKNTNISKPLIKLIVCQFCSKIQENLNENKQENSLSKHKDDDQNVKNALINDAEKNDIFDFFPGASMTKEQNLDDEIIESASQVSGPRKIEPYEPQTSRNDKEKIEKNDNQNILDLVFKDKLRNKIRTADFKPELTTKKKDYSRLNTRNSNAPSDRKKSNGSNASNKDENYDSSTQKWRVGSQSSLSDFSDLKH